MTQTHYEPTMTLREARDRYFADNHFGADGGYGAAWVDFKLGPVPMPFPNSDARRRAVRWHDLHHVVTGYATDTLGEFEIAAWELAAGCGRYVVPWQLNLGGLLAGTLVAPRRTYRAFVRGRGSRTLYRHAPADYAQFLDRTVAELRAECGAEGPGTPRASDGPLFALAALGGAVSAVASLALFALSAPLLLVLGALRRGRGTSTA